MVSCRYVAYQSRANNRIRQFDDQYQTFFYVNPTTEPPQVTWTRPGYTDGQAAPEQLDSLQLHQPPATGGGHASEFFNGGGTDAHPDEGRYAAEARQATSGIDTGAGDSSRGVDGERGFMGDMAKNAMMQKLGLKPSVGYVRPLISTREHS